MTMNDYEITSLCGVKTLGFFVACLESINRKGYTTLDVYGLNASFIVYKNPPHMNEEQLGPDFTYNYGNVELNWLVSYLRGLREKGFTHIKVDNAVLTSYRRKENITKKSYTFCHTLPPEIKAYYEGFLLGYTPSSLSSEIGTALDAVWGSTGGLRILSSNPDSQLIKFHEQTKEISMDKEELEKRKKEFKESRDIFRILEWSSAYIQDEVEEYIATGKDHLIKLKNKALERDNWSFRAFNYFTGEEIDLLTVEVDVKYKES